MKEGVDYLCVQHVRLVSNDKLSKTLVGLFVGTELYFYFFPLRLFSSPKMNVDFRYKNDALTSYVLKVLGTDHLLAHDFHGLVTTKLMQKIPEIKVVEIKKLPQFKIYNTFWGSGILLNLTNNKTGWKPFVSRFRKAKVNLDTFYSETINRIK